VYVRVRFYDGYSTTVMVLVSYDVWGTMTVL